MATTFTEYYYHDLIAPHGYNLANPFKAHNEHAHSWKIANSAVSAISVTTIVTQVGAEAHVSTVTQTVSNCCSCVKLIALAAA
eukprot:SAG11_NODE_9952_length_866_cov_2.123859_2_plen_83_part_00